jgi:signal peptidase I
MERTIYAGDHIVVNKINLNVINRNDLIVFNHPDGGGTQLVKRCVGLPGDTVQIIEGVVHINAHVIKTPASVIPCLDYSVNFPHRALEWSVNNFGPVVTPENGAVITIDSVSRSLYRYLFRIEEDAAIHTGERYIFRTDGYFVLGDHRGNSLDSHHWGFVSADLVIGKVVLVCFSRVSYRKKMRWKRIGRKLDE